MHVLWVLHDTYTPVLQIRQFDLFFVYVLFMYIQ